MPLFEYRCSACGRSDERLVRAPAPAELACAGCGAPATRLVPLLARPVGDCGPGLSSSGST